MYQLLDSGRGQKLERFGSVTLVRPSPQALWPISLSSNQWQQADASFTHEQGWVFRHSFPQPWTIHVADMTFLLRCTDSGQVGIFPEQIPLWQKVRSYPAKRVLNLFAYSGGSSIAAALAGAEVTHIDASKKSIGWAKENAQLNHVSFRAIVEDVSAYCARACRRKELYDGIILDPPTFGRGNGSKRFCIERDLMPLLQHCSMLQQEGYLLLSCHTPGYTPEKLAQLMIQYFPKSTMQTGSLFLPGPLNLPSGVYVLVHF